MNWWQKETRAVITELGLGPEVSETGLRASEVSGRLMRFGKNELAEKKRTSLLARFFGQLNDFMVIILIAAAGISLLTSWLNGHAEFEDPIVILLIVGLNAALGLIQESKAEKSISALKKLSAPVVRAVRDGRLTAVKTGEIVPGDVILLEAGDFVPADARLLEAHSLKVEESALTGESLPVEKDPAHIAESDSLGDRKNMVFSGSSVTYGRGRAIVVATGMKTEVGRIAELISDEETPETPLQKKLAHTGKILGMGAIGICILIFFMGLLRNIPPFDMFMTSVSLAVAAIPEGLPAIVTIMLAIGVQRMAKQKAIIRKLPAVETLGQATVICSDKTGTLTQNKMKVVEVYAGKITSFGEILKGTAKNMGEIRNMLTYASLCSDCVLNDGEILGDPTESALVEAAQQAGIDKNISEARFERVAEIPFDSKRKLMTTVHKYGEKFLSITKGAPDFILEKCTHYTEGGIKKLLTDDIKAEIRRENEKMAQRALRVIAVASTDISLLPKNITPRTLERELTFIGLCGMWDAPRKDVEHAVKTCIKAGIKPVMVTGDHVLTAEAVAKRVGIMRTGGQSLTGAEMSEISDEELAETIFDYSVFARVTPEHKMRIVKAFQANGQIVAMTGDGVNDAPALKAADIGCAMGISGTDVAKSAADMVLADDNFSTVVEAVKAGRGINANIRKAVHFLLSSNVGEIITIFMAILLGFESPLLAIQLLWVNLITDSLPAIALGLEKTDDSDMEGTVLNYGRKGLFSADMWQRIALEGSMIGMIALLAFAVGCVFFDTPGENTVIAGRTMAFATLSISQLVHAFNMRSKKSIFSASVTGNKFLVGAFFSGIILQVSVIMIKPMADIFKVTPLGIYEWCIVAGLCLVPVLIVELEKLLFKDRVGIKIGHREKPSSFS